MCIETILFPLQTTVWIATLEDVGGRVPLAKQRDAVRKLIDAAGYDPEKLRHTSEGSPFLDDCNSLYISISHCRNRVAIAFSPSPVGIDIEAVSPRTLRVIERITTENERVAISLNVSDANRATRLWCAKESAFKLYGTQAKTITEIALMSLNDNEAITASPFSSRILLKSLNTHLLAVAHRS